MCVDRQNLENGNTSRQGRQKNLKKIETQNNLLVEPIHSLLQFYFTLFCMRSLVEDIAHFKSDYATVQLLDLYVYFLVQIIRQIFGVCVRADKSKRRRENEK